MKNLYLFFFLLFSTQLLTAQGFDEVPSTPFADVQRSTAVFEDIDHDGDADVLIAGSDALSEPYAEVFFNDGTGYFEETDIKIKGFTAGDAVFADFNLDGSIDLITGGENLNEPDDAVAALYLNDGAGDLTEDTLNVFSKLYNTYFSVADANNDGAPDILMCGESTEDFTPKTILYWNDGSGNFSIDNSIELEGVLGSVQFGDVNNDGSPDIIVSGDNASFNLFAVLYLNDGTGNFSEAPINDIQGLRGGSLDFFDADGDNDLDLIQTGSVSLAEVKTNLYLNDGAGNFTLDVNNLFAGIWQSSVNVLDVNNDGHDDLLMSGYEGGVGLTNKLYINDGNAIFTELTNTGLVEVNECDINSADINGDGAVDIIITGRDSDFLPVTKLYLHDGEGIISSTDEWANEIGLQLFPNPATEMLSIQIDNWQNEPLEVQLHNAMGQLISSRTMTSGNMVLDINHLPSGVYFVQFKNENGDTTVEKVIVE